jgi:hypothetical protein
MSILYYITKLCMKLFYDHSQDVRAAVVWHQHRRQEQRKKAEQPSKEGE